MVRIIWKNEAECVSVPVLFRVALAFSLYSSSLDVETVMIFCPLNFQEEGSTREAFETLHGLSVAIGKERFHRSLSLSLSPCCSILFGNNIRHNTAIYTATYYRVHGDAGGSLTFTAQRSRRREKFGWRKKRTLRPCTNCAGMWRKSRRTWPGEPKRRKRDPKQSPDSAITEVEEGVDVESLFIVRSFRNCLNRDIPVPASYSACCTVRSGASFCVESSRQVFLARTSYYAKYVFQGCVERGSFSREESCSALPRYWVE